MFEFEIDGVPTKADVTFHTAWLYEAEFGSSIVSDLFGRRSLSADEGSEDLSIDFTKTDWNALNRALWAAVKTADKTVPGYEEWTRRTRGVNLWLVGMVLSAEVADCFFRPSSAGEESEEEGERPRD
jgi:hypothetical protein